MSVGHTWGVGAGDAKTSSSSGASDLSVKQTLDIFEGLNFIGHHIFPIESQAHIFLECHYKSLMPINNAHIAANFYLHDVLHFQNVHFSPFMSKVLCKI